jgi:hypothetical protein
MILIAAAATALASDVDGTWKATANGPNGTMERTFVFKTDGAKLTGETVSSIFGKSTVEDGKVDGNNIAFSLTVKFQDNEMKVEYKGKVSGSDIELTALVRGQELQWKGKKQ